MILRYLQVLIIHIKGLIIKTLGVLMAAGYSKRMGFNKSFLKLDDEYLCDIAMRKLKNASFDERFVVANELNYEYLKTKYPEIKILLNAKNSGQNTSIRVAIKNAISFDSAMFFAIDQPFLKDLSIKKIQKSFEKGKIIVPRFNHSNSLPTIFSKEFFIDLANIDDDFGGKYIIKKHITKVKFVDFSDELEGFDIDKISDLERLKNVSFD